MVQRTVQVRSARGLGLAVAEARMARGWTQAQLAERAGISRDYLAHVERGRTNRLLEIYLRAIRRAGGRVIVTFEDSPGGDSGEA